MFEEPGLITSNTISSNKCPYQWIKEYAQKMVESALIEGDLLSFYNSFSEKLQADMQFIYIGRLFAQYVQLNGKFVSIEKISEPQYIVPGTDIWFLEIALKSEKEREFSCILGINGNKKICEFEFSQVSKYHTPNYIKKELYENEEISKDPFFILSKPVNNSKNASSKDFQYPCALLIHTEFDADVDIRLGFCCPGLDFGYLPSNKIGLIRGEYTNSMFDHKIINGKVVKYNDPVLIYTTKMIELALSRKDISHIFLILHSYASLSLSSIAKKFQGIIHGVILINPYWNNGKDLCIEPMKEEDIPKDIPILLLGGGHTDTLNDYKIWEAALRKSGNEYEFYDHCDSFLFESTEKHSNGEHTVLERHISDVPLRRIAQWIRSHSNA